MVKKKNPVMEGFDKAASKFKEVTEAVFPHVDSQKNIFDEDVPSDEVVGYDQALPGYDRSNEVPVHKVPGKQRQLASQL